MEKDNHIPKVSDTLFKELLLRGYALEGKTRVWDLADSKLWYLTPEQAQGFLDLEKSEEYQKEVIQKEIDLINEHVGNVISKVDDGPLNIIDLGCGDGKKAEIFINKLKGKVKLRYCPIDISSYMVEKAIARLTKVNAGEVVKFQWNISDFENLENVSTLLRHGEYKKNLFLLLGNTLGNFEINEMLYKIRISMKEGDILVIGNGLDNRKMDEILVSYHTDEMDHFMRPLMVNLGLSGEDVEFGVRFKNSRVEVYYTLKHDKEILFQTKKILLEKGDQILTIVSYKYTHYDLMGFLKFYFDDIQISMSEDKSYALVICKK